MPKLIIDGQEVECRDGIPVLQAALEAGLQIPHYCYHPGLSVVASCRLCLMEMKMPHPKTKELGWAPKLFPSCQTPVKDGMEVRFESEKVKANQKHVMEYYLLNHPLDCPVCDKAGECYLQDYTEDFGSAASRMVEEKYKNPKKDIGSKTLLYQDRCVLCTRCVRFTEEISGSGELTVVNRGNRGEIDVFPGEPLENPLQGNVVDLCPVGALLDKEFLFKQRVWLLKQAKSITPADSSGATIWIDHNEGRIWRIRPRFNEKVNEWWISDEQRFNWKHVHADQRLHQPVLREDDAARPIRWEELPKLLKNRLLDTAADDDGQQVAAVLSPMMACEEAYLLARFVRAVAPQATLVLGHVPVHGQDQTFKQGFTIPAEKCPNRKGVETLLEHLGGPTSTLSDFLGPAGEGRFKAVYLYGGYAGEWVDPAWATALKAVDFLAVHDLFPSPLSDVATLTIPAAAWAEREGTFMNRDGLLQPFERAIPPLEGVKYDGQFFLELSALGGMYRGPKIREKLAPEWPALKAVFIPRDEPEYAH